MLDHRIHNVIRATWTVLGVGMFGSEVIPNAFFTSTIYWHIQQTHPYLTAIHLQKSIRRS